MASISQARRDFLSNLPRAGRAALIASMSASQRRALRHHWHLLSHEGQVAPAGDWPVWLLMAGRGFGKTRAGAEWVRALAERDGIARIALVGASLTETRSVIVDGPSGLRAVARPGHRPRFEPSKRLLRWPSGAEAHLYSAAYREALRGSNHSHAWCDELAKWEQARERAQRAARRRPSSFPAPLPPTTRALADAAARRTGWRRETLQWRVAELDPAIAPGTDVRVPGKPGTWRVDSWEWRERGVELSLTRASGRRCRGRRRSGRRAAAGGPATRRNHFARLRIARRRHR
jgi:hypothetical protein